MQNRPGIPSKSRFLAIAQKYGLSQVPQNAMEAMQALAPILSEPQRELAQYLFMDPTQFQGEPNAFPPGQPMLPTQAAPQAQQAMAQRPQQVQQPQAPRPAPPRPGGWDVAPGEAGRAVPTRVEKTAEVKAEKPPQPEAPKAKPDWVDPLTGKKTPRA